MYRGRNTLTGPTTAGFQDINKLPKTKIKTAYTTRQENGAHYIDISLENRGKSLAFFTQIQWLDKSGKPVRPSFYTDNFMTLLPGEKTFVTVETDMRHLSGESSYILVVRGFNVQEQRFDVEIK